MCCTSVQHEKMTCNTKCDRDQQLSNCNRLFLRTLFSVSRNKSIQYSYFVQYMQTGAQRARGHGGYFPPAKSGGGHWGGGHRHRGQAKCFDTYINTVHQINQISNKNNLKNYLDFLKISHAFLKFYINSVVSPRRRNRDRERE